MSAKAMAIRWARLARRLDEAPHCRRVDLLKLQAVARGEVRVLLALLCR